MANHAKKASNPLNAALPTLFTRTGEPRRVKGFRGNNKLLSQAMRTEKVLVNPNIKSLTVYGPNCAMVLDLNTTRLLQGVNDEDGYSPISGLILNGFDVTISDERLAGEVMDFRFQRGLDKLTQGIMVIETEGEEE